MISLRTKRTNLVYISHLIPKYSTGQEGITVSKGHRMAIKLRPLPRLLVCLCHRKIMHWASADPELHHCLPFIFVSSSLLRSSSSVAEPCHSSTSALHSLASFTASTTLTIFLTEATFLLLPSPVRSVSLPSPAPSSSDYFGLKRRQPAELSSVGVKFDSFMKTKRREMLKPSSSRSYEDGSIECGRFCRAAVGGTCQRTNLKFEW